MFIALATAGVFALLISMTVARSVSVEEFGIYSILVSVKTMAVTVACFGIPTALAKIIAEVRMRNEQEVLRFANTGLILVLVFSALTCAFFVLLASPIGEGLYDEPLITQLIPYSALAVLSAALLGTAAGIAQGFQNVKLLAFVQVSAPALSLLAITILLWVTDLRGVFIGYFAAQTTVVFVTLLLASRMGFKFLSAGFGIRKSAEVRRILSLGTPVLISGVIVGPVYWLGSTYLAIESGFESVGYFAIALTIFLALVILPNSTVMLLIPKVSELTVDNSELIKRLMAQTARTASVILFPILFAVGVFAKYIVDILYGSSYSPAAHAVYLIAAAGYFFSVAATIGAMMMGMGRMWVALGLNSLWAAVFLVLTFLMVGQWDDYGLAGAFASSYGIHLVMSFFVSKRVIGVDFRRAYLTSVVSTGFFALGFLVVAKMPSMTLLGEILLFLAASASVLWIGRDTIGPIIERLRTTM